MPPPSPERPQPDRFDLAVIGGGVVGAAIAYGAARTGAAVALLDEGDVAFRAARANFGLVTMQSRHLGPPHHLAWVRASIARWPALADRLSGLLGQDIAYRNPGSLIYCVGEADHALRAEEIRRAHNLAPELAPRMELLDRRALDDLTGGAPLGPRVVGASYTPGDGHVDPLRLLRALIAGFRAAGGAHRPGAAVTATRAESAGFTLDRADGSTVRAARIVIAAGLGTTPLAAAIGLDVPMRAVKGQNIVTERLARLLPFPGSGLRQTEDGTVQIGVTYEHKGLDDATTTPELAGMAARAIEVLPALRHARMVRVWAGLRPMTPDGWPAYAASPILPGAYVATCHAGVVLAAAHADILGPAILAGSLPGMLQPYHPRRFSAPGKVAA
ncbi:MAG: FAD-binding oxidoreductase [Alphaproteobacteria bacterium]|nr:FAD-binding oxidoreductase [Alphaproteobacteria bacterium]